MADGDDACLHLSSIDARWARIESLLHAHVSREELGGPQQGARANENALVRVSAVGGFASAGVVGLRQ